MISVIPFSIGAESNSELVGLDDDGLCYPHTFRSSSCSIFCVSIWPWALQNEGQRLERAWSYVRFMVCWLRAQLSVPVLCKGKLPRCYRGDKKCCTKIDIKVGCCGHLRPNWSLGLSCHRCRFHPNGKIRPECSTRAMTCKNYFEVKIARPWNTLHIKIFVIVAEATRCIQQAASAA